MSDFIFRVFPEEEVFEDKTGKIKKMLIEKNFISGEEFDFYGELYLKAGDKFCDFIEVEEGVRNRYKEEVRILITQNGYGLKPDKEKMDFMPIYRKNVIEIWNIDGEYLSCDNLCVLLKNITEDIYLYEWDIL